MYRTYSLFAIVEGLGDDDAIPALLRNYYSENGLWNFSTPVAINSKGVGRLTAPFDERRRLGIEYYVQTALRGKPDGILVVLDGDKECIRRTSANIAGLGTEMLMRAKKVSGRTPISVVVADPEVEIWFLAAHSQYLRLGMLAVYSGETGTLFRSKSA
ncbi:MAG: hypothetical protein JSS83_11480 [Cyanobacteria bacterium SZAS LIN-3]|nr:hypothetical protein [Cyanobacteria bacterium SZAS LIN-3]